MVSGYLQRVCSLLSTCVILTLALSALHNNNVSSSSSSTAPLLIVSFDGFRWNYFSKTATPNFDSLMREGSRAVWIKNSYVTKTFPNHFTIVTGLFEEIHGVVANSFYDPKYDAVFDWRTTSNSSMFGEFGAEPIWVTAALQNRTSGCHFWVGCDASIKGVVPSVNRKYNKSVTFSQRIDTVVRWLSEGEGSVAPVDLALLYFNEPDHTAHQYGPDSEEVKRVIAEVDSYVGELRGKLEAANLWDKLNVLLTSDHGMAQANCSKPGTIINLSKLGVSVDDYTFLSSSPVFHVWNKTRGGIERLMAELANVRHINMYTHRNMPKDYHYKNNRRIPPLLLETRPGYVLVIQDDSECGQGVIGYHGFNNSLEEMHPFFIGVGPGFKRNASVEHFRNIDLYPLMCELLGLAPADNNGSLDVVRALLTNSDTGSGGGFNVQEHVLGIAVFSGALVLTLILSGSVYVCWRMRHGPGGRTSHTSHHTIISPATTARYNPVGRGGGWDSSESGSGDERDQCMQDILLSAKHNTTANTLTSTTSG